MMRMNLGCVLLLLLTLILACFVTYRFWIEDVRSLPFTSDSIYSRPVVELFLENGGEITFIGDVVSLENFSSRNLKLIVRLSNNSSEPSVQGSFAAGILIALKGARVDKYELGGFSGIIGVSENGSITNPINSSIVEFFANKLPPWQSIKAELRIIVENGSDCALISYRGWIIDEDDAVIEPISGTKEHYIARFPPEGYPDNPPDSRWAGRDFMKYRLHNVSLCFNP